jgi:hypothetical protein
MKMQHQQQLLASQTQQQQVCKVLQVLLLLLVKLRLARPIAARLLQCYVLMKLCCMP